MINRWFVSFLGHLDSRNLLINNCGYDSLVDEALLLYTTNQYHKYRDGLQNGCSDTCLDVSAKDLLVSVIALVRSILCSYFSMKFKCFGFWYYIPIRERLVFPII